MTTPLAALKHNVTGAIERGEKQAIVGQEPTLKPYNVYWSPEGRRIATVNAISEFEARRKAPQPYRKYLGEIYAVCADLDDNGR